LVFLNYRKKLLVNARHYVIFKMQEILRNKSFSMELIIMINNSLILMYLIISIIISHSLVLGQYAEESFERKPELIDDPYKDQKITSDVPVGESYIRIRLIADLNFDGYQDIMISHSILKFGRTGGPYAIFLNNGQGKYFKFDDFFIRDDFARILKRAPGTGLLTYYLRFSYKEGELITYSVQTDRIMLESERTLFFENDEDRELFKTTFSTGIKLQPEYCIFEGDSIIWKRCGYNSEEKKKSIKTPSKH